MDDMYSGRLVMFFQHGELATGFCTAQADIHLQVLCAGDLHVRLPVQRVVHAQPLAGVDARDTQRILGLLAAVEEQQIRIAQTIDPETLGRHLTGKILHTARLNLPGLSSERQPAVTMLQPLYGLCSMSVSISSSTASTIWPSARSRSIWQGSALRRRTPSAWRLNAALPG